MARDRTLPQDPDSPVRTYRAPRCYGCGTAIAERGHCKTCNEVILARLQHTLKSVRGRPVRSNIGQELQVLQTDGAKEWREREARKRNRSRAIEVRDQERALWTERTQAAREQLGLPPEDEVPF